MEAVTLTPQDMQQRIAELRAVVLADKKLYDDCKERPKYYDGIEVWKAVSRLIIVHANFYRGEMLRAKHNMARYMRGDEPTEQLRLAWFWAEDLHYTVENIYDSMERQDETFRFSQGLPRESQKQELVTAMLELGNGIIQMEQSMIKDLTDTLERYTYAG